MNKPVYACCIRDGCGMQFDTSVPEQRNLDTLRLFWTKYCPKHRVGAQPFTSLESRAPKDILHFLYNVNRTVLNIAREEKPTGSWPEWVIECDMQLTELQREFRLAAKAVQS